jgi:hypothetical protein
MSYLASSPSFFNKASQRMRNSKPANPRHRRGPSVLMEAIEARQLMSVSASWAEVPISSAAKTADSQLSNYRTFDLKVSVSSGDAWVGANMLATLSSGQFYVPASNNSNTAQQPFWSVKPNLEFDTFVTAQNFASPIILGPTTGGGSAVFSSNTMNVVWGTLGSVGAGTYTVARLTIKNGSAGSVKGFVTHKGNANDKINIPALPITGGTTGGSISGNVFNDANGNLVKDSGEAGVSGRTIYLDTNLNSVKDGGEVSTTTDASGNYKFSNLAAGTYKIREILPSGWVQTTPTSNFGNNATLTSGQNVSGKNFGTRQTTAATGKISGTVFHDFNRNGVRDTGDTGLSGWTVWIDTDLDGVLDSNERRTTTDSSGNYSFGTLAAGTYKIRTVKPSGWVQTTPSNNFGHTVTLSTGQSASGENFGADN